MEPIKDAKAAATGDGSGATPDATTPTTVEPPTSTGSTSELGGSTVTGPSTTSDPVTAATYPRGISMVQGPLITGIDIPLPESSSTTNYHPDTPTTGSSVRYGGHVASTSTNHQEELNEATDYGRGLSSNTIPGDYYFDKEVHRYVSRRDNAFYDLYPGTERDTYDYIAERNDTYTTNIIESTAHMIKGSLGAAVLSMHEAYMIGGLWTSLAVTVFVGVLIGYIMIMLIRSAQKMYRRIRINKLSYPDLAEAAAATSPWRWVRKKSKAFRYTVEVILFLHMCGSCCIYQIVIAQSIKQIIKSFHFGITAWPSDIRMYILITTLFLIPLCLIRSIKLLAPFAFIADIFTAICVFSTLYYSLLAFEGNIMERAAWKNLHGFIRVCGICMYGTSGACFALPVENNMKSPRYFPTVVQYAMVIVVLLTATTGFFGYWAWGEQCRSPITVHMPPNTSVYFAPEVLQLLKAPGGLPPALREKDGAIRPVELHLFPTLKFTTILQFLLVMMLSTSFAVNFWVPFRIVWHYIMRKHKRRLPCWDRTYRVLLAILIMVAAIVATHTITVMIFLGQFFLGFVALIFPAFIEFIVDWEEQYASRTRVRFAHNLKNFGLVFLGLILTLTAFYSIRDTH